MFESQSWALCSGYSHRILCIPVLGFPLPWLVSCGWGQDMVATGAADKVVVVSGGNYEQYALFYYSRSRLLA